jgi:hypothetical protein
MNALAQRAPHGPIVLLARCSFQRHLPAALWLADLDEFDAAWADYTEWRISTYKSAAAAVVKKKAAAPRKVK